MAPFHAGERLANVGSTFGIVGGNRRRKKGVRKDKNRRMSVKDAIHRMHFTLKFFIIHYFVLSLTILLFAAIEGALPHERHGKGTIKFYD